MAYLRKEKETVEIDYPLDKVWMSVKRVLVSLSMTSEKIDDATHYVKVKTKARLFTLSSILFINAEAVDEEKTRVEVAAETPVTTITAMMNFGGAKHQINIFLMELGRQLDMQQ
jgi:hypothetical protein